MTAISTITHTQDLYSSYDPRPGQADAGINLIELFPSGTVHINSVSTNITLAPLCLLENDDPDPCFDRDNPLLPPIFTTLVDTYPDNGNPDTAATRAHIDTGAGVSCTNLRQALHDYRPYTAEYPTPISLTAALSENAVREGEGYLRMPAPDDSYIEVLAYFSPKV